MHSDIFKTTKLNTAESFCHTGVKRENNTPIKPVKYQILMYEVWDWGCDLFQIRSESM